MAETVLQQHEAAGATAPEQGSSAVAGTAVATSGRPASSYGAGSQPQGQPHDPSKPAVKRQIVCFSFYKVMPEWRRLDAAEQGRAQGGVCGGAEAVEQAGGVSVADVLDGWHARRCGYVRVVDRLWGG